MASSIKEFYDRHNRAVPLEEPETALPPDTTLLSMRNKGHRYFCIFAQIPDGGALRAVELGFGSLNVANALSDYFGFYEAVDISADVLIEGHDVQFRYRQADLCENFPYPDNSFDVVIAMMIVEHLFDPFHSFREIARILRQSGFAFVNLPNVTSVHCRFDLLRGRLPWTSRRDWFEMRQWDGGHLHYFDIDHVIKLGNLYGLDLIKVYPVGRFYWLKKIWPGLLCHEINYVFKKHG